MAPPLTPFNASELPEKIQYTTDAKKRHPPLSLQNCALKEMVQYKCDLLVEKDMPVRIACKPVVRLFRKCQDNLMVETTVWEGLKE